MIHDFNITSLDSLLPYIPFNCQFLILNNDTARNHSIIPIIEIFNRNLAIQLELSAVHFGTWNENEGLKISDVDFYNRRLDLNGTILQAGHAVCAISIIHNQNSLNESSSIYKTFSFHLQEPDGPIPLVNHILHLISETMNLR